ncbi:MAG: alanine--tRNA ligase [Verrucomicrobiae bacterium]|nr:alanine--tRNA ligase [Verrucomicrobiae bacterium]
MTSAEIRQSFLEFFRSKQHTIVPGASLMPGSPNLLFTNAGMNQFVPIFLGERAADVSRWAGAVPGSDTRATDTQKCIRAGGKHNDLDDVGLDTYHHTFFEMLGNWSFGDYFKREAIEWAWELVVERWKFPAERLYATIYQPDVAQGDPGGRDEEAWNCWAERFRSRGLDPEVHIVNGGRKDNFWMMGETGPCGPCSELHVDLTPAGDTRGSLVNRGTAECIEIWNLVFIQYNANPDGTFSPLPARHVDTGMGFERVTSILQGTKGFTDFVNARISNYETDIFRPIFDELERLSGRRYGSTLPRPGSTGDTDLERGDVAFRVIADHLRTLTFAVADGIQPGNTDRNYVLRRILRRAVRYGRTLGLHEPFFFKLVDVLAATMGGVFPELRTKQGHVKEVLRREEEAFNRTLDRGITLFEQEASRIQDVTARAPRIGGAFAFRLYDTYGFPLDLTELMARERGLTVDTAGFEVLMEEQRARARAAQKKTVVELSQLERPMPTKFVGYETLETPATVLDVVRVKDRVAVVLDTSSCYAEMGGQVGDTADLGGGGELWRVGDTQKTGHTWLHFLEADGAPLESAPAVGATVTLSVHSGRRAAIQRHHTVTHLLHWALHEVVGPGASQKGSSVTAAKLTFDFNSAPLTPGQVADVERLVNERVLENAPVTWTEVPYADVRDRGDVLQFFGDRYGDVVRVVQIGGGPAGLDGFSMELCGGTHTRATGEIGLFRIVSESAIAAGVRRIEAVAGLPAHAAARQDLELLRAIAGRLTAPVAELEKRIEALLAHQKSLERQIHIALLRNASNAAAELLGRSTLAGDIPLITHNLGDAEPEFLQAVADALKGRFPGVLVLGGGAPGAVTLLATVAPDLTRRVQAGRLIQAIAPIVDGKGGGRPESARGGGRNAAKLDEALARVRPLLEAAAS